MNFSDMQGDIIGDIVILNGQKRAFSTTFCYRFATRNSVPLRLRRRVRESGLLRKRPNVQIFAMRRRDPTFDFISWKMAAAVIR